MKPSFSPSLLMLAHKLPAKMGQHGVLLDENEN